MKAKAIKDFNEKFQHMDLDELIIQYMLLYNDTQDNFDSVDFDSDLYDYTLALLGEFEETITIKLALKHADYVNNRYVIKEA